jgi:hypothetical protein
MKIPIHHLEELQTSVAIRTRQAYDAKWQQALRSDNKPKTAKVIVETRPLNTPFNKLSLT